MEEVALSVHGTRVYGQWHGKKPKAAALLIHGFSSSMVELGELPAALEAEGIGALTIDLRGHGLSAGERGRVSLDRASDDIQAGLDWIRSRLGRVPVGLVGHSLGGAFALGFARHGAVDAVVAAHPPRSIFEELNPIEQGMYHVVGKLGNRRESRGRSAGYLPRRPMYREGYSDRALAKEARAEGYLQEKVNIANYSFAVSMDAERWASGVRVPALCIRSDDDRVVDPRHTQTVIDAIPHAEVLVHDGGHACFRDRDRTHVFAGVADFLSTPMSYVFLDFDKTIVHGDVGPMFGAWLFDRRRNKVSQAHRRPVATARKAAMWAGVVPYMSWMSVQAALYKLRAVRRSTVVRYAYRGLKGVPVAKLDELMAEFAENHVAPLVYPQILQDMEDHIAAGRKCIIITTGMERLVSKCLPYLPEGVKLIGCKLEERNGRLTGRIISGPLYGADKANILLAYCDADGIDPADCHAYSDHYSDHHMLDAVGHATCINPASRLRRLAARKAWRVLDLPDPRKEREEEATTA